MKKTIGILLLIVTLCLSFIGCKPNIIDGSNTEGYTVNLNVDKDTDTTLRILVPNNDGGLEKSYMEALIPGFNAIFPNVKITFDQRTISDEKYAESVANAVASNNVPDLFYTNTVFYYYLVSKKCVINLEPYYQASEEANVFDMKNDFYSSFFDMSSYKDGRYIVPRSADTVICAYNKEILQAAGINPETDSRMTNDWTWENFISVCEDLNTFFLGAGKKNYGDCYASNISFEWEAVFNALMESFGSKTYNDDGTVAFDSEETRAMANMIRDLNEKGRVIAPYGNPASFSSGKAVFCFSSGGPAQLSRFAAVKGKFDVLPFPAIGQNPKIGCGFAGWGISSKTEGAKRDIAWQFLNYMISQEGQLALINSGMSVPPIRVNLAEEKQWAKGYSDMNLDAYLVHDENKVSSKFFTMQDPSCTFDILSTVQDFMINLTTSNKSVENLIKTATEYLTQAVSE